MKSRKITCGCDRPAIKRYDSGSPACEHCLAIESSDSYKQAILGIKEIKTEKCYPSMVQWIKTEQPICGDSLKILEKMLAKVENKHNYKGNKCLLTNKSKSLKVKIIRRK